jgi:hypothetical protein
MAIFLAGKGGVPGLIDFHIGTVFVPVPAQRDRAQGKNSRSKGIHIFEQMLGFIRPIASC